MSDEEFQKLPEDLKLAYAAQKVLGSDATGEINEMSL
jgi:hypothetical protein